MLQPRRHVHHIASNEMLTDLRAGSKGNHHLAGGDAHTDLKVEPGLPSVQLLHRLKNPQAGAYRALGIVLMSHRSAEHSHYRVTNELLNRGAVTFQLVPQQAVIGAESGQDILGVSPVSPAGRAHQIAEEHRDDLPLLCQAPWALRQRPAAVSTKTGSCSGLSPAPRTPGHARSLDSAATALADTCTGTEVLAGSGVVRRSQDGEVVPGGSVG